MIRIRRLAGGVLAALIVAVSMLLVVPAGSAASPRSDPPPPPSGERSATARQLPGPLPALGPVAGSAATSADSRVTVLGQELGTCATLHGAVESSGRVDLAGAAAGDAAVSMDGADPIGFVQFDEHLALSGGAGLARPAPPGSDQVVRRCAAGEAAPGSANPVTMSPAQVAAVPSDISAAVQSAGPVPPADVPGSGRPASDEASEDIGPGSPDDAGDATAPDESPVAAHRATDESMAESLSPAIGPAPWGVVVGVLGAVAVALVVPSAVSFALHNRRGPKWVRANVQTVATVAPAVGVSMTPETDWPGLPTFGVQLALRADGGTRSVTEVEQ